METEGKECKVVTEINEVSRIWKNCIEKLNGAYQRRPYFSERKEGEINITEDEQDTVHWKQR